MPDMAMRGDDQRLSNRHHLVYYLQVFDPQGEELVGHLADLSVDGLMRLCPRSLVEGQHF
ncbi:MAG: hypothetical protein BWK76_11655 [Desulfobulbaceae bacterium A2]|nr:MAG: hypothetical protein BWK76_11655 [Desulfobulbaceae bacterium A2]